MPGSTEKLEQLVGDRDRETGEPTHSLTETRHGIEGTDLGYPFEMRGRVCFLFGDTLGPFRGDPIACTDAVDGDEGIELEFLTDPAGRYLRIRPDGQNMAGFEVPVAALELGWNRVWVVVKRREGDRAASSITRFDPERATFTTDAPLSSQPDGKFVQLALREQPEPFEGQPPGGPFIWLWGTGQHRASSTYLMAVPRRKWPDVDHAVYFAGLEDGAPTWSDREADAAALFDDDTVGNLSATWSAQLGLWILVYDSRSPPRGVHLRTAPNPWGPWTDAESIFDRSMGPAPFIHYPLHGGPQGPVIGKTKPTDIGGPYAPFVVERFTRVTGDRLDLYWLMSTWNPYVVVLMHSELAVVYEPLTD